MAKKKTVTKTTTEANAARPTKKKVTKKKTYAKPPKNTKVIYDKLTASVFDKDKPMTVTKAKELIGWQEVDKDDPHGHHLTLGQGKNKRYIRLNNNNQNRPFRLNTAKRYASEMIRKKWKQNGEPWIYDKYGECQSAQHRNIALILA